MTDRAPAGETRTVTHLQRANRGDVRVPEGSVSTSSTGVISQGSALGRYIVLYRIGSGGMGEVYAAYDPQLDRKVALKVLRSEGVDSVEEAIRSEASALARLVHPNVVTVFDLGEAFGRQFIAMEFLSGRTLKEWLADESPTQRKIVDVFTAAGRGLAAAHEAGLVHRDFKPSNVILTRGGEVKVLDFGLASDAGSDSDSEDSIRWLGTPRYMAPEREEGHPGDALSDQYSFCAALHEALVGPCPADFEVDPPASGQRAAERQAAGDIPGPLKRTLRRGLARRPEDRFADVPALLADLAPSKTGSGLAVAVALVLVVGLLLAQVWPDGPRCDEGEGKLSGLWDSSQKNQLEAAFMATGAPFAADSWLGVESALDGYVGAWKTMHIETCESTHVRGEQSPALLDRRMLCLDQRLQDLRSLTTLLLDADLETVSQAGPAVTQLRSLGACADRDRLTNLQPLPEDPEVRGQVTVLYQVAADQLAGYHLGQRPDLATLETAVENAEALDYPPLDGEISWVLGRMQHFFATDASVAEASLIRALERATEGRDQILQIRAYISLTEAVGLGRPADAEIWERLGRAALEAIGAGNDELAYELETAAGHLDWAAGRRSQATEHFREALAAAERVWEPEHPKLARPLGNLGLGLDGPEIERAISILERAYGRNNPRLASHLVNLAASQARKGQYEHALTQARRTDRLIAESYGEDNRQRVFPLIFLAQVLMAADQPGKAEGVFRQALALGSDASQNLKIAADLEIGLAKALHLQGRDVEAWPLAQSVLALVATEVAAEDPLSVEVFMVGGGVAREVGVLESAEKHHRRARALAEANGDDLSVELLLESAQTYLALGQSATAVPFLEEGLERVQREVDRGIAVRLHLALAMALRETEPDRARQLATAARGLLDESNRMHQRLGEEIASFLTSPGASQPML